MNRNVQPLFSAGRKELLAGRPPYNRKIPYFLKNFSKVLIFFGGTA